MNCLLKGLGGFLAAFGILVLIVTNINGGEGGGILIGVGCLILGLFGWFCGFKSDFDDAKRKPITKSEIQIRERQFIKECENFGIGSSIKNQAEREKAELIANNKGLKYQDIDSFYRTTWVSVKGYQQRMLTEKRQKELEAMKYQERLEADSYNRYLLYSGRSKRIAMLEDLVTKYEKAAKDKQRLLEYAHYNAHSYSTPDPFVVGGAASGAVGGGIVGAGAGIVSGTQAAINRTAEQVANNATFQAAMPVLTNIMFDSHANFAQAEDVKKAVQKAKAALVDDKTPMDTFFSFLTIETKEVRITDTGAFYVTAIVKGDPFLKIYQTVPAVIDGVIDAVLYQEGKECGTAHLVFPLEGVKNAAALSGICTDFKAKKDDPYSISYHPYQLWAIEEMPSDSSPLASSASKRSVETIIEKQTVENESTPVNRTVGKTVQQCNLSKSTPTSAARVRIENSKKDSSTKNLRACKCLNCKQLFEYHPGLPTCPNCGEKDKVIIISFKDRIPTKKSLLKTGITDPDADFVLQLFWKYLYFEKPKGPIYKSIISKYGKKEGTEIYNKIKPILEQYAKI